MQKKIYEALENFNIEIVYVDDDVYCDKDQIVYFTQEKDSNFSDDKNKSVVYEIQIKYKYRDISNVMKYVEIKELLKEKGYSFKDANDSKDGDLYIKNMIFEYEETINGRN